MRTAPEAATSAPKPPPLGRALALGAALLLADAFVLNQGIVSFFVALGVLLVGLPRALLPRFRPARRERLRNVAVYLCAALLVFPLNAANNHLAATRAESVIAAVNAYRAQHGRYPQTLYQLVPSHLGRIPRAKLTLLQNEFMYLPSDTDPQLAYVALPPFGRPVYSFARDAWGYVD